MPRLYVVQSEASAPIMVPVVITIMVPVVITIVVPIVIMVAPAGFSAALAGLFKLFSALACLFAVLAVLAFRIAQALFGFPDILPTLAAVIAVGTSRNGRSRQ